LRNELAQAKVKARESVELSREELEEWRKVRKRLRQMFPPREELPEKVVFEGSPHIFYGDGVSLKQRLPQLFRELAQTAFAVGITQLTIVDGTPEEAGLKISAPAGVKSFEFMESDVIVAFSNSSYRRMAEFLGRLQQLPRYLEITRLSVRAEQTEISVVINLRTCHCPKEALGDVPT